MNCRTEAQKEARRRYRAARPEACSASGKRYRDANKEKERARGQRYRAENKEKELAREARYRETNRVAVNARSKSYRAANPDRLRDQWLSQYGINQQDYDRMIAAQDYGCAICRSPATADRTGRLHVDHDHATGKVRGLLCQNCNTGLGLFRDDQKRMEAAIRYLAGGAGDA